jgi:hypothetical protein
MSVALMYKPPAFVILSASRACLYRPLFRCRYAGKAYKINNAARKRAKFISPISEHLFISNLRPTSSFLFAVGADMKYIFDFIKFLMFQSINVENVTE